MVTPRSVLTLAGIAVLSAGCGQSPASRTPHDAPGAVANEPATYHIQWSPRMSQPAPVIEAPQRPPAPRVTSKPRESGSAGWGRHYPWRGTGPRPAWYGVQPHEAERYVSIGSYFYPYYAVGADIYPVYSMPYTLASGTFVPFYGTLPPFGPNAMAFREARIYRHHRNQIR